ncbi:hypothetical protein ACLQ3C_13765 [Gordonia sp. DT30]|uniref:hypothetical protein n=1 Tax=unclassified Gordonia (in: high G+C Gram-positive bacteria) TaxID=2657482 RepID=UPI003CEB3FE7
MKTVVVSGNPKPGSRTLRAGERVAKALGQQPEVVELATASGLFVTDTEAVR